MTEKPFFFHSGKHELFGLLHLPENPPTDAFIFSHPLAEEKLWSHRVFVSMARELARRGYAVLRFDYLGAGDSSGALADASLESHLTNLQDAFGQLATMQPQLQRVGLLGLRLGATFAALLRERHSTASVGLGPLILWDPIVDGEAYFQELLRSNLSTQLAVYGKVVENRESLQQRLLAGQLVNVDGYELGKQLFEDCATQALLPLATSKLNTAPTLIVQIAASENQKTREDLQTLAASYPKGQYTRATEQPFWREIKPFYGRARNLELATLQWLEQAYG